MTSEVELDVDGLLIGVAGDLERGVVARRSGFLGSDLAPKKDRSAGEGEEAIAGKGLASRRG